MQSNISQLWPDEAESDAQNPRIETFWPEGEPGGESSGASCLVFPGGGYSHLSEEHEGRDVARWLNARGIAAHVVFYSLAPRRFPAPLRDARRALELARQAARDHGLDPAKVGALGFSAGGHLTAMLATGCRIEDGEAEPARPDWVVLCYPVISMIEDCTHQGSVRALLGYQPSDEQKAAVSNERLVSPATPPTFLWHASDDTPVPPENSLLFVRELHRHGVPCELHVFESGGHGKGLTPEGAEAWPDLLETWLRRRGLTV